MFFFLFQLAATLFAEPPSATTEDAVKHFEEAEKLYKDPHLENKFFLSKCYISLGRNQEACDYLRTLLTLSPCSEKEKKAQAEAQNLLKKYAWWTFLFNFNENNFFL